MSIKLNGDIVLSQGMWTYRVYQEGDKFILETQSEMMTEAQTETFTEFDDAVNTMYERT